MYVVSGIKEGRTLIDSIHVTLSSALKRKEQGPPLAVVQIQYVRDYYNEFGEKEEYEPYQIEGYVMDNNNFIESQEEISKRERINKEFIAGRRKK